MKTERTKDRPFGPVKNYGAQPQQGAVSPEEAKSILEKRVTKEAVSLSKLKMEDFPQAKPMTIASGLASNTVAGVGSIAEMSRALRHDVDLINEFVVSNIEFLPTFGSQKGALGCLIDGVGNSFDIADLMVQLLREAGYTADYVFGEIDLSATEAGNWLGTDTSNSIAAGNLLSNGGIPNTVVTASPEDRIEISHCWVRCNIDGTDYYFDPAMKSYTNKSGIDLATAMGYNAASFLSDAESGATITADYVKDINRSNIRDNLDDYTANLVAWIQQNQDGANLDDILGGREIVPQSGQERQSSLPYKKSGSTETIWASIPNNYKSTLDIEYDTIDESFYSSDIHGKRLTITFNGSLQAELRLDGALIATSSAQGTGTFNSVLLTITHPYPTTFADQSVYFRVLAGKSYIIAQAWGNCGREMYESHNKRLKKESSAGGAPESESVLGQWLEVELHKWNAQTSFGADIINRMCKSKTVFHHQCGLVGYEDGIAGDLGAVIWGTSALDNNPDIIRYTDDSIAFHIIAFEALSVQQIDHRVNGISATTLVDTAYLSGLKIYDGKTSNWNGTVKPSLTNYPSQTLTDIETAFLNNGLRVAIPEDGSITVNEWTGYGYFAFSPFKGALGIITGGFKGGTSDMKKPDPETIPKRPRRDTDDDDGEDPTNLQTGAYLYKAADMAVGSSAYPYGLTFERYYNSDSRYDDGKLGRGWTDNLNLSATVESDGLRGMGWDNPIAGAAALIEIFVSIDLFKDLTKPFKKYMTAVLSNRWLIDQLTKNVVIVEFTEGNIFFIKQPNGSYLAPTDTSATLEKNLNDTYTFKTAQGVEYNYNLDGTIHEINFPFGVTVSFTYSSGKLTSVTNGMGRTLTISYTGERVTSVSDGNGRSVSYNYDLAGNLTNLTDANGEISTYEYDEPGRLTKVFLPETPLVPAITNTYDSLGRIKQQVHNGNTWELFVAGSRSEEVNPNGKTQRLIYFNRFGDGIRYVDALGNETKSEYDGRRRLTKVTAPEGNCTLYEYDKFNNVTKSTEKAKPGSGLTDIVQSYTYDANWKKLETATNALGRITSYSYDINSGLLVSLQGPAVNSQTPTTTFTYNGRGQIESVTDETGMVTRYQYHSTKEDLESVVQDEGTGRLNLTTSFGYDSVGNVVSVTDPKGNQTNYQYDNLRRLFQSNAPSPLSYVTEYVYDKNGRLLQIKKETGIPANPWQLMTYTYNDRNQLKSVTDDSGNTTSYEYDVVDRLWKVTDAESRVVEYSYDDVNRVVSVTNNAGIVTATYEYSDNDLISSFKDARNNVATYEFDGFDRPTKIISPDGSYEEFSVNANGLVTSVRDRAGNVINFLYDELDRVSQKAAPGLSPISYEYDLSGRVTKVSDGSDTIFSYDTAGRLIQETRPDAKVLQFQLDANGNTTKFTYPDGYYVEYSYDELDRMTGVKLNGDISNAVGISYDKLSRRTKIQYDSGSETNYEYANNGFVDSVTHKFSGSDEVTFDYQYNKVGQLLGQTVDKAEFVWEPTESAAFSYGNANSLNQYPSVNSKNYAYNGNGSLSSDGIWTYSHDSLNRLTSASKSGSAVTYGFDAIDRKATTSIDGAVTKHVVHGGLPIADYDGADTLQSRYIYGTGTSEPLLAVNAAGDRSYLHADVFGSIIATSDSTSTRSSSFAYGPFGEVSTSITAKFGFLGLENIAAIGRFSDLYVANDGRTENPGSGNFNNRTDAPSILEYGGGVASPQIVDGGLIPTIFTNLARKTDGSSSTTGGPGGGTGGSSGGSSAPTGGPTGSGGGGSTGPGGGTTGSSGNTTGTGGGTTGRGGGGNNGTGSGGASGGGANARKRKKVPPPIFLPPIIGLGSTAAGDGLGAGAGIAAGAGAAAAATSAAVNNAAQDAVDAHAGSDGLKKLETTVKLKKSLQAAGRGIVDETGGGYNKEYGTKFHKAASDFIKNLHSPYLEAEVSYLNGVKDSYGKGSARVDVLFKNALGEPLVIFDWKTAGDLGRGQEAHIRKNLPDKYKGIPIFRL